MSRKRIQVHNGKRSLLWPNVYSVLYNINVSKVFYIFVSLYRKTFYTYWTFLHAIFVFFLLCSCNVFYFLRWIGNSLSLVPFIFTLQQILVFFLLIFKSCSLLLTLNNIFRWMNNHLNYYVNEWSIFFVFTWTDSHIVFSNQ